MNRAWPSRDRRVRRHRGGAGRWWLASLFLHALVFLLAGPLVGSWPLREPKRGRLLELVIVRPPDPPAEEVPEPPEPDEQGQIVEVAPPKEEKRPEEAEYLSEHDIVVEKETRAERFVVNPEVLSPEYSEETAMEQQPAEDLQQPDPARGATAGNERFDPDRHGALASLPSPFKRTNQEGDDKPLPAAAAASQLAGAPQNDLLREERADATQLNTKEYLYAGYLKRIRRLVNFYWEQNIDNLPASVRFAKPSYTTAVNAVLDSNGALEHLEVTVACGSPELDDAVVRAFRIAGPFPNPPEGLIEKDGRVYLPDMTFTVQLGVARARYEGIDPRAGVQFPGLMKSPR